MSDKERLDKIETALNNGDLSNGQSLMVIIDAMEGYEK